MRHSFLREERGVAMLLELVLVAAVLVLVGLALYQSNHRTANPAALLNQQPAASADTVAAQAATAAEADVNNDAEANAAADTASGELSSVDDDVTNLGDSFDENAF